MPCTLQGDHSKNCTWIATGYTGPPNVDDGDGVAPLPSLTNTFSGAYTNVSGVAGPMMPHMMEEGEVIDLDAKPPPPPPYEMTGTSESFSDACIHVLTTEGLPLRGIPADHCAVVKAQEEAWLAVLEEYKDSDVAVFGDVIVDDWPETLKKVASYSHV